MGIAVLWDVLFEALCERADRRSGATNIGNAAATTALLAYIVGYHVVPKRGTLGFESHLSKGSLALTYVALGAGFALAALLRQRRRRWHRCFRASLEGWNRCSGRRSCAR
jgi:hypothetical protein